MSVDLPDNSGSNTTEDCAPTLSHFSRHFELGFDDDDVTALITSIDASQSHCAFLPSQLPAEILLQVLEYVPVDYVLDWRLVCRGFRDAIDGRVLYHHLRRTELIGYMGSRHNRPMEHLDDEQYDSVHQLRASFHCIEDSNESHLGERRAGPVWNGRHAVFKIDETWFHAFQQIGGAAARNGDIVEDADAIWLNTLDRLELRRADEGFGTLRWCIRLDHAVLDIDFPLESGRNTLEVRVQLHKKTVRVVWKDMLFGFLKTEASLRRMLEKKQNAKFTFSHGEDCLRAIRRQRLLSALDPNNKVDRHIKWSIRLLCPLFGLPRHDHRIALEDVETDATNILLLLRREAAMNSNQLASLQKLAADYRAMITDVDQLEQAFIQFKSHFSMSGFQFSVSLPTLNSGRIPRNAIAWPDELRSDIEDVVGKWTSQKKTIEQMRELLEASNLTLTVQENYNLGSDF